MGEERSRVEARVVRPFRESDAVPYAEFISHNDSATLYHTLLWRDLVTDVFGHRARYLVAIDEDRITGIMPLFHVKKPLLGSKLLSLPYDVGSGGPLAEDAATEVSLARAAEDEALRLGVDYLELRPGARAIEVGDGFARTEPLVLTTTSLADGEDVWSRVAADQRAAVRKSRRRGVSIRPAESRDDIDDFYHVLSVAFRSFGTPPYGRGYFRTVWERLAPTGHVRALVAEAEGECVGGAWLYCFGRSLVSKFAAALPAAVSLRVFPALYGATVEVGQEIGAGYVSWGTSAAAQTGLIAFKERWAGESRPAAVLARSIRREAPDIERYYESGGLARAVWRKLPLRLTQVGGQILSRWYC